MREECGLTGTKEGCGEGECGACTILLDGEPVNSCLIPFAQVRGARVKTIEGLKGKHPLQDAFVTEGGAQCGICTPGMILAAAALPKNATLEEIRLGLAGNLCRCTGYEGIYRAIRKAKRKTRKSHSTNADRYLFTGASRTKSVREALGMLRDEGPLVPLAGCTDVYVNLNFGTLPQKRFLNLWALDELRRIEMRHGALSIGALATYTRMIRSALVRKRLPILAAASREVGGAQIQNRGTLGGNIANASPAGDTLPVLAAAEAILVLRSAGGTRRVPFNSFYTGYRKSVARPDELIVAVEVPPVPGRQWFRKVGTRAAQAISKVVMAAIRAPRPRIALGSVAPTVIRLPRTEAVLSGGGSVEEAREILSGEIRPIDDIRSTAEYRRRVCQNLLEQFWSETA